MSDNNRFEGDETKKVPLREQVRQEFIDVEERGKAGREQLIEERGEPHENFPQPLDSRDDASWANISVDQLGEAVGLVYQDEEPLNTIEKIEDRDDNRWSMNPASAEDFGGLQMRELLKPGEHAPDFTLSSHAGAAAGDTEEKFTLSALRGKNVVLVFYPADWSSVCGDQLTLYNEILPMIEKLNAELFGISVDGVFCHKAFRENRGYKMTLLSDFEPKGDVAKKYGVYRDGDGFSERALFVIDKDGVIRYSYVSPIGINPGANEILQSLREIQAAENGKGEHANA